MGYGVMVYLAKGGADYQSSPIISPFLFLPAEDNMMAAVEEHNPDDTKPEGREHAIRDPAPEAGATEYGYDQEGDMRSRGHGEEREQVPKDLGRRVPRRFQGLMSNFRASDSK